MATATELANRLLVPSSGKKTLNADGTYSNVDPSVNYDRSSIPTVQGSGTFQSYDYNVPRDYASGGSATNLTPTSRGAAPVADPVTGAPLANARGGDTLGGTLGGTLGNIASTPIGTNSDSTPIPLQAGSRNTDADFAYKQTVNDLFRDQSNLDSSAKLEADRTKSNLTTTLQAAKDNYIKSLESSKEYFGNTGTLRSGIFLKKQGDISTEYSKDAQGQLTNAQQHLEDLARETATRKQNIDLQRQAAEKAQADARKQSELQLALIEAQNKAYKDFKDGLLNNTPTSNGAPTGVGTSNGGQIPMGSGGQVGIAFAKDPSTGGTLFDGNGQPVTNAAMAQNIIDQRNQAPARSRQPGDGLVWDSNAGGYVDDPTWRG